MKHIFLAFLLISLAGCKMDAKNSNKKAGSSASNENQIQLESNELNSNGLKKFVEEIQRKQKENPDTVFEVVKKQNSSATILSAFKDDYLYPNKNFYIFIGLGNEEKDRGIQKTDWEAIYHIMNYVANLKYRVLINVNATAEHLRLAAEDSNTAIILWSSHGNTTSFYDYNGEPVSQDIFKNKSKSFYQFILSSCYGRIALDDNYNIKALKTFAWSDLTNSNDLKAFLVSDAWNAEFGKSLLTPISGITCTANGKQFSLMKSSTLELLDGDNFDGLEECRQSIASIKKGQICVVSGEGAVKIDVLTLKTSESYDDIDECLAK